MTTYRGKGKRREWLRKTRVRRKKNEGFLTALRNDSLRPTIENNGAISPVFPIGCAMRDSWLESGLLLGVMETNRKKE